MDGERFDQLTRMMRSRRTLLNGVIGSGVATLLGLAGAEETTAHNALPACRRIKNKQRRAACLRRARRHNASHATPPPPGCTPSCAGRECGGDGCGGSCGSCGGNADCVNGTCRTTCTPSCAGKNCGSNGCGGSCGTCSAGRVCSNPGNGGTCQCPAATCAGICCGAGQQCFGVACWPDSEELAFVTLINNHRAANGVAALTLHNLLGMAAELHSQDQAATGISSHTGSDGSSPWQRLNRVGYAHSWEAENIYWSSGSGSASDAFNWWKDRAGHNANMLSTNVTQFGIGRARSSAGIWYWTTSFGHPA